MKHRIYALACGLVLSAAACSAGTPTEPRADPSIPLPDELPIPPRP